MSQGQGHYYNQNHGFKPEVAPPSYEEVIPTPPTRRPLPSQRLDQQHQQGYESDDYGFDTTQRSGLQQPQHVKTTVSWYNPRYWGKKMLIGCIAGVIILIIIIVIIAVVVSKVKKSNNSSYPDYSNQTYALKDTCESAYSVCEFQSVY